MRQKFTTLRSTVVPLPIENIDTDQIIPARFLKATTREGFGENLFRDWRYDKDGNPKADFVMNSPIYKGEILSEVNRPSANAPRDNKDRRGDRRDNRGRGDRRNGGRNARTGERAPREGGRKNVNA